MLVSRGKSFPKIHDLLELSTLCEKAGILLAVDTLLLHNLTIYAVQVRYPGDDPTLEEAKEAVPTAKFIRKLSRKFLGVE